MWLEENNRRGIVGEELRWLEGELCEGLYMKEGRCGGLGMCNRCIFKGPFLEVL